MVFYSRGICWEAIPGMMLRSLINSEFIWDGLSNAWLKMDNNTNSRAACPPKRKCPVSECNVPEKEKTTVSGLRRFYVLKERCRRSNGKLPWKKA